MDVLDTHIRTDDPEYGSNRARMQQLVAELRERLAQARAGGGAKAIERQRHQGKMPVRERIDKLLDPGSPFLELSALAAFGRCRLRGGAGRVCSPRSRPLFPL